MTKSGVIKNTNEDDENKFVVNSASTTSLLGYMFLLIFLEHKRKSSEISWWNHEIKFLLWSVINIKMSAPFMRTNGLNHWMICTAEAFPLHAKLKYGKI